MIRRRVSLRDDRGVTLVELLVTMVSGMVVLLGIFTITDVATRTSAKVTSRVDADQRARPVMQRLIDHLHSTCLGPNVAPVQAGSSDTSIGFLHQTGAAVSPVPVKRVVTLTAGTLSESVYAVSGGTSPSWTFSSTPSSTTELLTKVGSATVGNPAVNAPLFQYFTYENGQISTTPLPTPLSAIDAARTVQVTVSFSVLPRAATPNDSKASLSISDTAYLRFAPPSEDTSKVSVPCA